MPEGVKSAMWWMLGVGIIALIGLVLLILFGNLSGNVGFGQDSISVWNSTVTLSATGENISDLTNKINPGLTNIVVTNSTNGTKVVTSDNYTTSAGKIFVVATSAYTDKSVNVSAIVSYDEQGKVDTDNLITNYTSSVVNTAKQFPTVGTIVGIALLLVVLLGILIFAIKKIMGVASGSQDSGKSSKFGGSSSAEFG